MKKIIAGSILVMGAYISAWLAIDKGFSLISNGLESMVARKEESR